MSGVRTLNTKQVVPAYGPERRDRCSLFTKAIATPALLRMPATRYGIGFGADGRATMPEWTNDDRRRLAGRSADPRWLSPAGTILLPHFRNPLRKSQGMNHG